MSTMSNMPAMDPAPSFDAAWLEVGHGHRIYYEQAGSSDGLPVVLLHGGPGSGASPRQRIFFAADRFRIVQFDQRGCGRSTPRGEVAHNHTDALIADIEALRIQLGIERWLVFGGSWGSTLALAYAARHRERVAGLILRGVFLAGRADLQWFFHDVSAFAPQANERFLARIPRRWRGRVVTYAERCFNGPDVQRALALASAWQQYESVLNGMRPDVMVEATEQATPALRDKYRVQAHYLAHRCFLGDKAVMRAAASLAGLPIAITHGTHDLVCRPLNAWRVHRACAGSRLAWAASAGHSPYDPVSTQLLQDASACFADNGDFAAWPTAKEALR